MDPMRAFLWTIASGTCNAGRIPTGVTPELAKEWISRHDLWEAAHASLQIERSLNAELHAEVADLRTEVTQLKRLAYSLRRDLRTRIHQLRTLEVAYDVAPKDRRS